MNKSTGLYLYLSNSLNALCERLMINFEKSYKNSSFFDKKEVVIQTTGIAKWLSYKITDRLGVCLNTEFVFPKGFVENGLKKAGILTKHDINYYDKSSIAINILRHLREIKEREIDGYIDEKSGRQAGQFIGYLTDLFDQYLTYRPEFIENPDKISKQWQRELFEGIISKKFTAVSMAIEKFINSPKPIPGQNPVELFAISFLPPIYVSFFKKLAEYVRVNLYILNPSREFWFDEPGEKLILRMQQKYGKDFDKLHFGECNPILINNGKPIQDFFNLIYEDTLLQPVEEIECYDENFGASDIDILKSGIFKNEPVGFAAKDYTIQIHSYKTKLREVEGVYNYILSILNKKNRGIALEDIIVMCPKIDDYSPFIDAVFADKNLEYTISDSVAPNEDEGIKALFYIMDNLKKRLNANDFMELIELDAVKRKFELSNSDIEIVREWFDSVNLRWGLDKEFIKNTFESMEPFNTFEYGLKRLLFGYLNDGDGPIGDILPYKSFSAAHSEILGKILYIMDKFDYFMQKTLQEDSLSGHKKTVNEIIDTFIEISFAQSGIFMQLKDELEKYDNDRVYTRFYTFYEIVKSSINKSKREFNFLKGGITFCELVPLRSIPFRVVCLMGLNGETFPRSMPKVSFNEIEMNPKRGDRSSRMNDRLLFLETVLSVKEYLYISYIGKDIKRNNPLNPSIAVMELMDFAKIKPVEHPLHSFSAMYFNKENPLLINYSKDDYELAKNLKDRNKHKIKVSKIVKTTKESPKDTIILSDLIGFLNHPVKFFFKENSINFDLKEDGLKDRESITLDGLERYKLIKTALTEGKITDRMEYSGIFPHGSIGRIAKDEISEGLEAIQDNLKKIDENISFRSLEERTVSIEFEGAMIEGEVSFLYNKNTLINIEYTQNNKSKIKAMHILKPVIYAELLKLNKTCVNSTYFINTAECIKIKTINSAEVLKFAVDIFKKAADMPVILFEKGVYNENFSLKDNIEKVVNGYSKNSDDVYYRCLLDNFEFTTGYEQLILKLNDRLKELYKAVF